METNGRICRPDVGMFERLPRAPVAMELGRCSCDLANVDLTFVPYMRDTRSTLNPGMVCPLIMSKRKNNRVVGVARSRAGVAPRLGRDVWSVFNRLAGPNEVHPPPTSRNLLDHCWSRAEKSLAR